MSFVFQISILEPVTVQPGLGRPVVRAEVSDFFSSPALGNC